MQIECRQCATIITPELTRVDLATRNLGMGEAMLSRGTFVTEDGTYFTKLKSAVIVNVEDGLHMHLTNDGKRLNGCCGLDGCDGPNLMCDGCNQYVATMNSDCWMAHCIVFESDNTREAHPTLTSTT